MRLKAFGWAALAILVGCSSPPDLDGVYVPENVARTGASSEGDEPVESLTFRPGGACGIRDESDQGAVIVRRVIPCTYRMSGRFVIIRVDVEGLGSDRNGTYHGIVSPDRQTVTVFERDWTRK